MVEHDKTDDKPFVMTLLAILSFALGICSIVAALFALALDSDIIIGNIQILSSLDLTAGAIVSIIFAVLFIVIGIGLWKIMGWPKTILLVISILGVVIFPLKGLLLASSLAGKHFHMDSSDIIAVIFSFLGVILSVFILWYLSRPGVILAFEAKEMTSLKKRIRILEERIELGRQRCNAGEISKAELSRLRSDCIAEERLLRARIRHFEKLRLSRERKIKEKLKSKEEARKEREDRREEREAEKEERREEKEAEREEKRRAKEEKAEKEEKKEKKPEEEAEEGAKEGIKKKKVKKEEPGEEVDEEVKEVKKKVKKVKKEEPEEVEEEVKKKKKVKKLKKEKPKEEAEEEVQEKKKKKVKKVKKEKPEEGE